MKIIVGLGNPGKNYSESKHNIGFAVIDKLATQYQVRLKRAIRQKAWLGQLRRGPGHFLLVKPKTYMNNSGDCVSRVLAKYKVSLQDLLVVYDDADLDLGLMRLRKGGSSAGHRGIASVMNALGRQEVNRLKVGIGRLNCGDLTNYVLSCFSRDEIKKVNRIISEAAKVSLDWFKERKEKTVKID